MKLISENKKPQKKNNIKIVAVIFIIIFLVCAYITLTFFTPQSTVSDILNTFFSYDANNVEQYVIATIKIPRILGALMIGAFLAVGGAVMQGITRNYLASPDVVGISNGAGLGLTLAVSLSIGTATYLTKVICSLLGAAVATVIIFSLSSRIKGRESGVKLLLAGTALGMLLSALSTGITLWLYPEQGAGVNLWNNSGLMGIQWVGIGVLLLGLVGMIIGFAISGRLTVLGMGEETAIGLGQNVKFTKLLGIICVVFIAASTVSVVGNIGFIGLIIPNMVKMSVGEDYRKVIPYSALFGSMLLVVSDVISRLINMPFETPIGTITSIIGIPVFLYLINSRKAKGVL